jgi:hypothetical protein
MAPFNSLSKIAKKPLKPLEIWRYHVAIFYLLQKKLPLKTLKQLLLLKVPRGTN